MTAGNITNLIRIHFSNRGIKLFRNEPHKKKIDNKWIAIKDLGYPPGSGDTMGWRVSDGKVCCVETKTINDTLFDDQITFLDMMVNDNCLAYVAKERPDGNLDLLDWATKKTEVIRV
jgi:hypothetical protein